MSTAPMVAIPTIYNGITLKSRMEAQCALLFDRCGWKWEYEPKSFMLKNGVNYMPDFHLTEFKTVVECRGYESEKGTRQIQGFAAEYADLGYRRYLVIGPDSSRLFGVEDDDEEYQPAAELSFCRQCQQWVICTEDVPFCARHHHLQALFSLTVSEGKIQLNLANYWRNGACYEDIGALAEQFFTMEYQEEALMKAVVAKALTNAGRGVVVGRSVMGSGTAADKSRIYAALIALFGSDEMQGT